MASAISVVDLIRKKALGSGFDAVGFCSANVGGLARQRLSEFIEAGFHGDMGWMATRQDQRGFPQILWPEAESIVVVGMNYGPDVDPLAFLSQSAAGNISVYARNKDYHDLMKGRIKHLGQFIAKKLGCEIKVFVDTAPVMEKPLAQQAGLGWQGKHTNIVSRSFGSWLLLGEIYVASKLDLDSEAEDRCGRCSRCIDVCPTHAFTAPYQLDARKCISYLTIEHKGPIPLGLREAVGNRIYGCDDCLAVCPWNKFAKPAREVALQARTELCAPDLAKLVTLDDSAFRRMFSGSPIKRIGRDRFIRNVLIAIGNSGIGALIGATEKLLTDPNPVVAEAADWARRRLLEAMPLQTSGLGH